MNERPLSSHTRHPLPHAMRGGTWGCRLRLGALDMVPEPPGMSSAARSNAVHARSRPTSRPGSCAVAPLRADPFEAADNSSQAATTSLLSADQPYAYSTRRTAALVIDPVAIVSAYSCAVVQSRSRMQR